MKNTIRSIFVILLAAVALAACSSAPEPKKGPYNEADDQRSRAHQTQGELSSETSKK